MTLTDSLSPVATWLQLSSLMTKAECLEGSHRGSSSPGASLWLPRGNRIQVRALDSGGRPWIQSHHLFTDSSIDSPHLYNKYLQSCCSVPALFGMLSI